MKICFVALEVIPIRDNTFVGGTANNIIRLSKGLASRGHEVHIVTSDVNRILNGVLKLPYAEIHPIGVNTPYTTMLYGMEAITKLIYKALKLHSKENFDVFDIHSGYSTLSCIALLLSFSAHVPAVFTLYSTIQRSISSHELYRYLPALIETGKNSILSKVSKIIAISQNIKRYLIKIGVAAEKITCIPPTVETEIFNPNIPKQKARQKFGLGSKETIILYLGNWNPWKGADIFIESMGNLVKEFQNIRIVMAWGEMIRWHIKYRELISHKIKTLEMEPYLIELGVVNNVAELIAASDIVVVPFLTTYGVADIPLTVIEAMACGKPVIATRVGGIPEIVQDKINGLLVNPGVPIEIEKEVQFLLEDRNKAREIGLNAARTALEYSVDNIVPKLEKVYEELVDNAKKT
jgi:glycosyltransferase involved in cell wall biosynthesis